MKTENRHTGKKVERLFHEAIKKYRLIENGDRILIGLSGGKDSMALLELLAKKSKIFIPRFEVEAGFVKMRNIPYQNDEEYLKDIARSHGVRLHLLETEFNESTDNRHTHCFLCSWNRRKMLFSAAKELHCNKIALGHHKDDIIQTALMNMSFQGTFSSMKPLMKMDKFNMTLIRPLCLIRESEMQFFAEMKDYRKQIKNCPYEDASNRYNMKEVVRLLETINPEFNYSFFRAIEQSLNPKHCKQATSHKWLVDEKI